MGIKTLYFSDRGLTNYIYIMDWDFFIVFSVKLKNCAMEDFYGH